MVIIELYSTTALRLTKYVFNFPFKYEINFINNYEFASNN